MTTQKNHVLSGSYTIEASLLMGILLPLLVGIIYMGFFLHDRSFLQCAAHETAACASLHADDNSLDAQTAAQKLIAGRTLGTHDISASASEGTRQIAVTYKGTFSFPGLTLPFFGQSASVIRSGVTLSLERPSRRIQKIRGASKVINALRRKRE
ncbi:TadE/TadG family type IV pilus assembly protein [Marvinbryantia formatexigens]|nr:TadE/TadG family type IV pilus assembly protein [Marvinbryantia formatexigens]UWO23024.1 pilus assembly protein [Marvinbryantia formatexigens DSM 14469]SDG35957.1 TadE-like protein [Marvinbryantia formatexigens]